MPASGVRLSGGDLLVVRCAPPEDAVRLRHAVEAMRAAPGIAVEVVQVIEDPVLEVSLAYAGRVPEGPLGGEAASALGARIAVALSDLHALGVAHRRLTVEHVLVGSQGAVRLCGFGDSGPGDATPDVRALGDVLEALLDPRDRTAAGQAVRAAIERTRAEEAPTAAAIAASLASIGEPTAVAPAEHAAPRLGDQRVRLVAAAAVLVACVVAVTTLARPSSTPATTAAPVRTSSTTTSTTSTTLAARRVWPATPVTIEGAGATWHLGEGDDLALVAAWGCTTEPTPALVREDGSVWLVPSWEDGAEADYVTTIEAEVLGAHVEADDAGCDDLVVRTSTGTVRPLA